MLESWPASETGDAKRVHQVLLEHHSVPRFRAGSRPLGEKIARTLGVFASAFLISFVFLAIVVCNSDQKVKAEPAHLQLYLRAGGPWIQPWTTVAPQFQSRFPARSGAKPTELFSSSSLSKPHVLPRARKGRLPPHPEEEAPAADDETAEFVGSALEPEIEEPSSQVTADLVGNGFFLVGLTGLLAMFLISQREPMAIAASCSVLQVPDDTEEAPEQQDTVPEPERPTTPSSPLQKVMELADFQRLQQLRQEKEDIWRALGLGFSVSVLVGIVYRKAMLQYPAYALCVIFIAGYLGIVFEEHISFNKSGLGLLMAAALWGIRNATADPSMVSHEIHSALAETSEVVFFLLGAMSIVQIVEGHQGWTIITDNIRTRNKVALLWFLGAVTFCMSAVLDNLTSTVVVISLLRKLLPSGELRRILGAAVVIAANAGGVWTPIGDVTTTMLWINGQITTLPTMVNLLLPSIVATALPFALMSVMVKELEGDLPELEACDQDSRLAPRGRLVFACGLATLIMVPVFKVVTGLPPYFGMLTGLGLLWLLTDILHYGDVSREDLRAPAALSRIDTEGVLFFFGVLMSVACLNSAGILAKLSSWLSLHLPVKSALAAAIGLASAVVDNVPLVAAIMRMFNLGAVPVDDTFWQLVAYCAGTGGSILIIGSAAGVAFMGMEKVEFGWYAKRIAFFAFMGYLAGMATYFGLHRFVPYLMV